MISVISEDHGLSLISDEDKLIYSVGVSTGGVAELRMVADSPARKVVATTIDEAGLNATLTIIKKAKLSNQITLKLEDVSKQLPYDDNTFDYIYARLVLHYLSHEELKTTLSELRRILKLGKGLYIVVRSDKCPDANSVGAEYEKSTGYTYYPNPVKNVGAPILKRCFHTEATILKFVKDAGFNVDKVESYGESLFADFMRTIPSPHEDNLIEVTARK